MNILLAFKAEPDLTMLAEQEWLSAEQEPLLLSYVPVHAGMDEQAAAEIMLRQQGVNLTALSVGDARAEPFMRQLSALGFAELVRIVPPDGADLRFAPQQIAQAIAGWHQQNPQSLIITGSQSSEGNNGQTGLWLAELLGWPVLAGVVDFTVDSVGQSVDVLIVRDNQRLRLRIKLPAVLIVVNDGRYSLRVPGIRQKLAASKAEITQVLSPELNPDPSRCRGLKLLRQQRAGVMIEGDNPAEKARLLYEHYLRERMPR